MGQLKELYNKIKKHITDNPKITEENYCNINPYFGRYKSNGEVVETIYIGNDYIINFQNKRLIFENSETGKTTIRKV